MASSSVQTSKRVLRKSVRAMLRGMPPEVIQTQSDAVAQRVLQSQAFRQSKTISCYLSMAHELNTVGIVREICRAGKTLFVPRIDTNEDCKMDMLQVYDEEDLATLVDGTWGIAEPGLTRMGQPRRNAVDFDSPSIDLVLVPGLAFDRSLGRLGQGRGYYDRFISAYLSACADRGHRRPTLVALALQQQLLPAGDVPTTEHDFTMDAIVAPAEVVGAFE